VEALKESPFNCHVFVCTNDRKGTRKSCADGENVSVREALKAEVAEREWKGLVRVSQSGCLGLCEDGPNVLIYPQKIWFSEVRSDDIGEVIGAVEKILDTRFPGSGQVAQFQTKGLKYG
jgi:(2Fe-2S) ferredoxin